MTNITEKNKENDMHSHIDKAYDLIKDSLPDNYVRLVMEKLPNEPGLTSGIIRNLKSRITKYPSTRINVLNALVEVAKEYKVDCNKLIENLK